jgi:hypothetical protein
VLTLCRARDPVGHRFLQDRGVGSASRERGHPAVYLERQRRRVGERLVGRGVDVECERALVPGRQVDVGPGPSPDAGRRPAARARRRPARSVRGRRSPGASL